MYCNGRGLLYVLAAEPAFGERAQAPLYPPRQALARLLRWRSDFQWRLGNQRLRPGLGFTRLFSGKPHDVGEEGIVAPVSLSIFLLHTDRKAGVTGWSCILPTLRSRQLHIVQQHRRVAVKVAVDVGGLVTVAPQTPDKNPKAVEIVGVGAVGNGGPQPRRFLVVAILHAAQRKVRDDTSPFGVLGHIVGDGHRDAAGQNPARFASFDADQ